MKTRYFERDKLAGYDYLLVGAQNFDRYDQALWVNPFATAELLLPHDFSAYPLPQHVIVRVIFAYFHFTQTSLNL